MRPIRDVPARVCRKLTALFCDLDGTVTTGGKVTAEAFSALWKASSAGLAVIVVTGRPAGWADHLARMWPVHGVIGENGGLIFRYVEGTMRRYFAYDAAQRARFRRRLRQIGRKIVASVPGCAVAADQPYREFDLAIDFAEDVPPLSLQSAQKIKAVFEEHGAQAKISSIHVNGWFGTFDKLSAAKRYMAHELGVDPEKQPECAAFVGDSPNDEPMFGFFPVSIAVAGIRRFSGLLEHFPAYVTEGSGGAGLAEAVGVILDRR